MTISSTIVHKSNVWNPQIWGTPLDSVSTTPLETPGVIRWDMHPNFGLRGFIYLREFQSGGTVSGEVRSFLDPVAVNNITSGTTTTITTAGLTADIYVGGLLRCLDDAGGAGAAPEGQIARIIANTTTVITVHSDDAFSVSPAVNDDFTIIVPFACDDSAANDTAARVAGVAINTVAQYSYSWYQFYGINTSVDCVAAGTALPTEESLIVGTNLVTDGAGAAVDLRVARILHAVTSDTVLRKACVNLFCGPAFYMSNSTA